MRAGMLFGLGIISVKRGCGRAKVPNAIRQAAKKMLSNSNFPILLSFKIGIPFVVEYSTTKKILQAGMVVYNLNRNE